MTHSVLLQKDPSKGWGSELGVAVTVTPGSAPCPDGFVIQLPRQQDVVEQAQSANACTELATAFGFKADALKAGAEMGDQVLNIVRMLAHWRINAPAMSNLCRNR